MKHHQTVDPHARALQVVRGTNWCPSTYFETSKSDFKITLNLQYFLFL